MGRSFNKKLKTVTRRVGHTASHVGGGVEEFGEGFKKGGKLVTKIGGGMELVGTGLTVLGMGEIGVPLAEIGAETTAIGVTEQGIGSALQSGGKTLKEGGDKLAIMSKNKKHVKDSHLKYLDATNCSYGAPVPEWATKDKSLSHSKKQSVLLDKNGKDVHIAFRGTDPKHLPDLISDGHILFGQEDSDSRFREANETYKKVKEKYPDRQIHLSGHSLGSKLADSVFQKNCDDNLNMVGFNMGSNPFIEANRRGNECDKGNAVQYTTLADPISTGVFVKKHQKIIVLPTKRGNDPHTLANFTVA